MLYYKERIMNSPPPLFNTTQFNDAAFQFTNYLTKYEADNYYIPTSYLPALAGTSQASKLMLTDASNSIQSINQIGFTTMNYNGTIITSTGTELNYLHGSVPGTASASNAIVLDSSRNITNINNLSATGNLTIGSLSSAKTITINSNDVSGNTGIFIVNNGSVNMQYQMSSTVGYFGTYSNHNLNLMTNNTSRVIIDTSGQLKVNSTTDSTSITTGSFVASGGVGIAKNCWIGTNLTVANTINLNGPGFYIANGSRTALISIQNTTSTNDLSLQTQPTGGVYGILNISSTGMLFQRSTGAPLATASCPIDLGSTLASDCQINLFGNSYMIGANDNALKLLSGGSSGVLVGNGGSSVASTYTAQFTTGGSLQVGASLRATGFSTSGFSGWANAGLELHYSTYGQIYAYNRSTLLYRGVLIGQNEVYVDGAGHTSIGLGATASSWRLEVGTNTQSVSSYGYLNSGGSTGTSGSSGSVAFSAYFQGRVAVQGEIDILSDRRLKSDIRDITEEEASNFIHKCSPKHYCFKPETNNELQFGYIAQDICRANLDTLIVCREEKGLEELIDEDGFVSPKDTVFTVAYQKIPALLHKYILMQDARIKRLDEQYDEINKLREDIDLLMSRPVVQNWIKKNKD